MDKQETKEAFLEALREHESERKANSITLQTAEKIKTATISATKKSKRLLKENEDQIVETAGLGVGIITGGLILAAIFTVLALLFGLFMITITDSLGMERHEVGAGSAVVLLVPYIILCTVVYKIIKKKSH